MDGLKTEVCTMHCGMNGSLTALIVCRVERLLGLLGAMEPMSIELD